MNERDEAIYNNWADRFIYTEERHHDISTFPVRANNVNLGRLVVIGHEKMTQKDQLVINRARSIFTVQMYHDWKITRSLWKKKENFFEEMLHHSNAGYEKFSHLFHFLPNNPNRILSIKVEPAEKRQDIMQFLKLHPVYSKKDFFSNDEFIIMILTNEDIHKILDISSNLLGCLRSQFANVRFYIGVGRESKNLASLRKSYEDARSISNFIHLTSPSDSLISLYEDMESIMMFLKGTDPIELIEFYKKTIGELVEYDKANESHFLMTLKTYLDHNGNLQQTADKLHLSIAGLRYRLDRITALCDVDLKTGEGRFNCQLALQIYYAMMINGNKPPIIQ